MRIGIVVPGFSADADDWCIPALRGFVRSVASRAEVHVFALRYPYRAARYELFGARVTSLGGGHRGAAATTTLWLRTLALLSRQKGRLDVLHACWADETGALAALAGRAIGVPTVVSVMGGELVGLRDIGYGGQLGVADRAKTLVALRLADVVTAGSVSTLELARRRRPEPGAVRWAPLGVDLAMFSPPATAANGGTPRIVHVASLVPVKDQRTLLGALAVLRGRGRAFELEVVGAGPLEPELRALASRLGLDGTVRFAGAIPHEAVPGHLRGAHLFAQSSRHEGQGMAALEAAACGLALVGTRAGVLADLDGDAARTAPVGDAAALADAIGALLDDPAARARSAAAARTRTVAEFGLERCADRFLALYDECARRGDGRAGRSEAARVRLDA